jgi:hypothetical protein
MGVRFMRGRGGVGGKGARFYEGEGRSSGEGS